MYKEELFLTDSWCFATVFMCVKNPISCTQNDYGKDEG